MKTKSLVAIGVLGIALVVYAAVDQVATPRARLTVRVLDEQSAPVQGVKVTLTFRDPATRQGVPVIGTTDGKGEFSGEGNSDPDVGGEITKEGWYAGWFPFEPFNDIKDGHWIPWNPTFTTVLRPVGKPVAMYARRIRKLDIPAVRQTCGYDLEISDWVAPWGKGKVSDLMITLKQRRFEGRKDFDVVVSIGFSNPQDGILETKLPEIGRYSMFKWERSAPETGYEPTFTTRFSAKPNEGYTSATSEKQAYFFRVRTVEQNGHIVSALYGKIAGGIVLEARRTETCSLAFTYYLNPTSQDRNLEWDTQRNLIPGLSREETPREP